jgi:hypothetical protein
MTEVPFQKNTRKKLGLCSLPVRAVFEALFVLLVFVPVLLFLFKWPSAQNYIHGKVLSVSIFFSMIKSVKKMIVFDFIENTSCTKL